MAGLRVPLLVALILLAVALQTSDAGEAGEQEADVRVSEKNPRVSLLLAPVAFG